MRTNEKLLRGAVVNIFLCTCVFAQSNSKEWPEWFLFQNQYPQIVVGFGNEIKSAKDDAEERYTAYQNCIIEGTLEFYQVAANQDLNRNTNYFYYYSPEALKAVKDKLFSLDKRVVNILKGDYIEAFTLDSTFQLEKKYLIETELNKPNWIDKDFYTDEIYYYGIGIYTSKGREADAWRSAEDKAVFNILRNTSIQLYKVEFSLQTNGELDYDKIQSYKLKYLITGIEVLERYPDKKNNIYYALIRINKSSLKSDLNKK